MPTPEELRERILVGSTFTALVPTVVADTVAVAPSPPTTGTTLTPTDDLLFPDPATYGVFDAIIYPAGSVPSATTAEVVRVTELAAGVWTIERPKWGTVAKSIAVGWEIRHSPDLIALDLMAYLEQQAIGFLALVKRTVFTSGSGTHNYDADTISLRFIVCGAGGGGGAAITAAGEGAAGSGGAAGGVAQKMVARGAANSCTYAVGSAGAGGTTGGTEPVAGGNSTVTHDGTTYTGNGGGAGSNDGGGTAYAVLQGGTGGTSTNGDMNSAGQAGGPGLRVANDGGIAGFGGSSVMGGGGRGGAMKAASGTSAGGAGGNYGGGGGASVSAGGSDSAGAAGGAGIVVIEEYGTGVG